MLLQDLSPMERALQSVWLVQFQLPKGTPLPKGYEKCKDGVCYASAFAFNEEGLLMTTSKLCFRAEGCVIKARRHGDIDFSPATAVYEASPYGILILSVDTTSPCPTSLIAVDGTLHAGETVHHVGSPHEFVWSFMTGEVVFNCPENHQLKDGVIVKCSSYNCNTMKRTPTRRIMGHVWNKYNCGGKDNFEANCHAFTPIIQMVGLVSGPGAFGGPIFNKKWEVVGIVLFSWKGYQIGVPGNVMKNTYKQYQKELEKERLEKERPKRRQEGSSFGRSKRPKRDKREK